MKLLSLAEFEVVWMMTSRAASSENFTQHSFFSVCQLIGQFWKLIYAINDLINSINGLVQERYNYIANALELSLSCTSTSVSSIFINIMFCQLGSSFILAKLIECIILGHHDDISWQVGSRRIVSVSVYSFQMAWIQTSWSMLIWLPWEGDWTLY